MKKFFRKVHLWLSVPFGVIISALCLSGAALVFETEIMELCYPDRYRVGQVMENPLPIPELLDKVSATLTDSVTLTNVSISSDPGRVYQVGLSRPHRASVAVDPYTGEIKGRQERTAFFTLMTRIHRWMLDPNGRGGAGNTSLGKTVTGVSTLLFVFIILSGCIVWIPRSYKALKRRLKVSTGKGRFRFWNDFHAAGGFYTALILLVLALTGLTWSFGWYRNAFYKVFGAEVQQPGAPPQKSEGKGQPPHGERSEREDNRNGRGGGRERRGEDRPHSIYTNWQQVYDQLAKQAPDYQQITLSNGTASVSFNHWGNQRGADRYTFHPRTGEITDVSLYADQDTSGKMRGWIYSVHVGSWGGLFTRVLTFLAALIGGILPLAGYYSWIKRLITKRRLKAQKTSR